MEKKNEIAINDFCNSCMLVFLFFFLFFFYSRDSRFESVNSSSVDLYTEPFVYNMYKKKKKEKSCVNTFLIYV